MDFLELAQIVFQLLERLIGANGRIECLICHAARDEIFGLDGVPEIPVADLEEAAVG